MSQNNPEATAVVSKFETAKDGPSFNSAFQSAVLLNQSDQGAWKEAQQQLQTADLSAIGLAGFTISGVEEQPKDASGKVLAPELDLTATDGSGTVERVDAQGNLYDQSGKLTGQLQFGDSSTASSQTAGDASTATAPTTGQTAGDASTAAAPTTGPSAGDASTSTASTDGTAASTTDGASPPTPFGSNGRTMELNSDGTSGTYTIQGGDTLWSIAQDALTPPGQTLTPDQEAAMAPQIEAMVQQIAKDNNISNPNEIYPNQQITINGLTPPSETGSTGTSGESKTVPTTGDAQTGTTTGTTSGDAQTGTTTGTTSGDAQTGTTTGTTSGDAQTGTTTGTTSGDAQTGTTTGTTSGDAQTGTTTGTTSGDAQTGTTTGTTSGDAQTGTTTGTTAGDAQTGTTTGTTSGDGQTGTTTGTTSGDAQTGTTTGTTAGDAQTGTTTGTTSGDAQTGTTTGTTSGDAQTGTTTPTTSDTTQSSAPPPSVALAAFLAGLDSNSGGINPLVPRGIDPSDFANAPLTTGSDGNQSETISGTVAPNFRSAVGTPYTGEAVFDPSGDFLGSKFTFQGGSNMNFSDGKGGIVHVNNVDSIINKVQADGTVVSTINDAAGDTYIANINTNGAVQSFQEQPAASQ